MAFVTHASHNRIKAALQMADAAAFSLNIAGLDADGREHLAFLVAHAGLDWFVLLAQQTGRYGCSIETADVCRQRLLDDLAKPVPSKHRID